MQKEIVKWHLPVHSHPSRRISLCICVWGTCVNHLSRNSGQCNIIVVVVLCVLGHSSFHRYGFGGGNGGGMKQSEQMDIISDTKMNDYFICCMPILNCHSITEMWLSTGKIRWSFIPRVQVSLFHQHVDYYCEIHHEHTEQRFVLVGKGCLIFFTFLGAPVSGRTVLHLPCRGTQFRSQRAPIGPKLLLFFRHSTFNIPQLGPMSTRITF